MNHIRPYESFNLTESNEAGFLPVDPNKGLTEMILDFQKKTSSVSSKVTEELKKLENE